MPDPDFKTCCRCRCSLPASVDFFHRSKAKRDGLTSQCKKCRSGMWNKYYEENRSGQIERSIVSSRLRRQDPVVRERERIQSRERKRVVLSDQNKRSEHRERTRAWFSNNKARVNAMPSRDKALRCYYQSMRRAAVIRATPIWADRQQILGFYQEAKRLTELTGVPHEVDHIIPLRGDLVSGLHVQGNLRVITRAENRTKSNRYIPVQEE